MKLKMSLAIAIWFASAQGGYAQDIEYAIPQSDMKVIIAIPDGWEKVTEEQAKGELTPHSIKFQPGQKIRGNDDEALNITIFPATPDTNPFPDDFHKKIAAQSYSISARDCDTRMRKPALRAMALNGFPVAIFYSSCWVKPEALKAPAAKKFEATSYFITSHKRSFLYVSRRWKTNEMGNSANDLSDADKATLEKKEDELMDLPIFDIKLCDTAKSSDACATLASTIQQK